MPALPPIGNGIIAISTTPGSIEGPFHATQPTHTIRFSGYDWLVRVLPTDRLGRHSYSSKNVSVDERGFLHFRIARKGKGWSCSEVKLGRSLGYGTYIFTVEDYAHLEPAAVFSMFTWSDAGLSYSHREMNVTLSRWGHAEGNNAEFIVQPFYVRTNSYRFKVPAGPYTFSFRWGPGSALFRSLSGGIEAESQHLIAQHTFVGNIPPPSEDALRAREVEVLRLVADGRSNRDAGAKLFISEETVKIHMRHIMEKLGASDRTQAVTIAIKRGYLQV